MKKLKSTILLIIAAVIWGVTFVAQSDAMEHIEPFTFNAFRFMIGAVVLLPFIKVFSGEKKKDGGSNFKIGNEGRRTLLLGCILGILLCIASSFQQFGIAAGSSVGKAGFVTSFYIVLVPVVGLLFGRKTSLLVVISAAAALVGLYFLCVGENFRIERADSLYLLCAVFFAVHIVVVSVYSPYVNCVKLSCIQFLTASMISAVCMFIFEKPDMDAILRAYIPLLYAGVLSCGIAYTLQIIGQKELDPTAASLIMCLESVFSVIAGFFILNQKLSATELVGCGIMLAASAMSQLPQGKK